MMNTKTRLLSKREIADSTMEFTLFRPEGFDYLAGQTIDLSLIDPAESDLRGNTRTFSLVSAPHEPVLKIAMRIRNSSFKKVLKSMEDNAELSLEGPFGSFGLHRKVERPAVFLAGGIGITPIYSMVHDATYRKLENKIILFFSNRTPDNTPYLAELQALEKENPNFTLVATMTDMDNSTQNWDGEKGRIDANLLQKYLPKDSSPIYYLTGPQAMVEAMRDLLNKMNVDSDDIRFEEFSGY